MTNHFDIPLPPVGRFKRKVYDATDGDRWRQAKRELQEKCCGEVDSSGTCFAPACRQGEALRAMHEMLEHIDYSDGERKRLEAVRAEVDATIAEDAARWRQHVEIVRMGGFPDALTMRLTMRENEKIWETQYVLDVAKFGRKTVLGLKAIGMAAEQKAEELFSAMERIPGPHE